MVSVHQHLRLDDGGKTTLLANLCISRQGVGVGVDTISARDMVADGDHGPPFGKPGAEADVFLDPRRQAVQAFGDLLIRGSRERLGAGVHLNAGDDASALHDGY